MHVNSPVVLGLIKHTHLLYCPRKSYDSFVSNLGIIGEFCSGLLVLWIEVTMDESWCAESQSFIYLVNLDYPLLCKNCQFKDICPYKSEFFFSAYSKQQHEFCTHRGQLVLRTEEWFCNSRDSKTDNIGKLETFQKMQICPFILFLHLWSVFLPGHLLPVLPVDQLSLLFSPYGSRRLPHYVNFFPFKRLSLAETSSFFFLILNFKETYFALLYSVLSI